MSTSAGRLASWQTASLKTPGIVGAATRIPHLPEDDANTGPLVTFARRPNATTPPVASCTRAEIWSVTSRIIGSAT
jgi:hypothetical protein